jgi:hypothetical protein
MISFARRVEVATIDAVDLGQPKGFEEVQLAFATLKLANHRLRHAEGLGGGQLRYPSLPPNRGQPDP